MANKMQGEAEIVLDKRRILRLNMRARRLYEQATNGETVNKFFDSIAAIYRKYPIPTDGETYLVEAQIELLNSISIDRVSKLLWSCLEWDDRLLTEEKAADLIECARGESADAKITEVVMKLWEVQAASRGIDLEAAKKRVEELTPAGEKKKDGGPPSPPEVRAGGGTS
jgi:hypothetical protein